MNHDIETEIAAGLSAGGFITSRGKHALPPGTPCYNCGMRLQGPWCFACGQFGGDYHRSAIHLVAEAFESFTHADGRLWKTLPHLVLRPAALTRDYLAGKRASQVPPLRMFFVVLLIVFVIGSLASHADRMQIANLHIDPSDRVNLKGFNIQVYQPWDAWLNSWVQVHLGRAIDHPDRFVAAMGAWAHDFAFLMLPISALILAMLFAFRRRFVLFDHLVFSMHSLSFQGVLFSTCMGLRLVGLPLWQLLFLSPVHLFFHMRGVYGLGKMSTLLRMAVLFLMSSMALGVVMMGLLLVGLETLNE
jgi:hypothetical protein